MKKYALPLLLLPVLAWASSTFTPHYNLEKPRDGATNWGSAVRDNADKVDGQMYITQSMLDSHLAAGQVAHHADDILSTSGSEICLSATNVQQFLDCLDLGISNREPKQTKGNITTNTNGLTITGGSASTVGPNVQIDLTAAGPISNGILTSNDWNTFNNKEPAQIKGTISASLPLSVSNGTNATVGPNVSISIPKANTNTNGYLSSTDWNTFNGKEPAQIKGEIISSTNGVSITNGTASTVGPNVSIDIAVASGTTQGLLSSTDWTTFNDKQPAGAYALTSDLSNYILSSEKGSANGVATLDPLGKIPGTQLPDSVFGALVYQGAWDASGGTFPIPSASGQYWVVSVDGTLNPGGHPVYVGDWLVWNGTTWDIIDHSTAGGLTTGGSIVVTDGANAETTIFPSTPQIEFNDLAGGMVSTITNSGGAFTVESGDVLTLISPSVINLQADTNIDASSNQIKNAAAGTDLTDVTTIANLYPANGYTEIVMSEGGTTAIPEGLTNRLYRFTGTVNAYNVTLPTETALPVGYSVIIVNMNNTVPTIPSQLLGFITVRDSTGTSLSAGTSPSGGANMYVLTNPATKAWVRIQLRGLSASTTNVPNAGVTRDGTGNFTAGTITASLSGNATTATTATKATNVSGGVLGSVAYQSAVDTTTFLPPNTTTTQKFLSMTGDGANGAAPTWATITPSFVGLVEADNAYVPVAVNETIDLTLYAAYGYTINSFSIKCASGSITAKVQINGVDVTGLTSLSVNNTIQTFNASGANTVAAGDRVTVVTSSNSSCLQMGYTLKHTRL